MSAAGSYYDQVNPAQFADLHSDDDSAAGSQDGDEPTELLTPTEPLTASASVSTAPSLESQPAPPPPTECASCPF